jgi:hypothetical protein
MSFRLYDVLENLLVNLEEWKTNPQILKQDVIDSVKERTLILMTHIITTPMIGTSFAYPGDIPELERWIEDD